MKKKNRQVYHIEVDCGNLPPRQSKEYLENIRTLFSKTRAGKHSKDIFITPKGVTVTRLA